MPFSYYKRLSKRQKAIYRQSDEIRDVPLRDLPALRKATDGVREALEQGDRVMVEKTARRLVGKILMQLEAEPLTVRVLATRPRDAGSELHGLYTREEGKRAIIQVWMRTAVHKRTVQFRTFLRTLLHEVLHHLDFVYFALADSFHTEGFYARESSIIRQIAPSSRKRGKSGERAAGRAAGKASGASAGAKTRGGAKGKAGGKTAGKAGETNGRKGRPKPPAEPTREGPQQMELPLFG